MGRIPRRRRAHGPLEELWDAAGTAGLKVGDAVTLTASTPTARYPEGRLWTKTHFIPAASAAWMPGLPSSKTRQVPGRTPMRFGGKQEHVGRRLAVLDVVRGDDDGEELGQSRLPSVLSTTSLVPPEAIATGRVLLTPPAKSTTGAISGELLQRRP
jgi:hypothetical protein